MDYNFQIKIESFESEWDIIMNVNRMLFKIDFENLLFINSVLFISLCSSVNSDPP